MDTKKLNEKKQFLKGHERELFVEYYETMGEARSYIKLASWCKSQGWINHRTGGAPTRMTLWFSMWRWAIKPENQEEAYKVFNKAQLDEGLYCSKEFWNELMDERARVCLADGAYLKWKRSVNV